MPPAPLPPDETARVDALVRCDVLDTPPEPGFDDLTTLAATLAETPIALVSLVDANRQWFKSRVGLDAPETPRDQAFCAHALLADAPLVIENAAVDPRTSDNPLVLGAPHIRFYAGFPLRLRTGESVGTLCVIDTRPRTLDDATSARLAALARQAASQLDLRRSIRELALANDAATRANEAKSTFLANMSHEIRTPMTAILGYADLLAGDDPLEREPAALERSVDAIARNARHLLGIIDDVLDVSKIEAGRLEIHPTDVDPRALVIGVADLLRSRARTAGLRLDVTGADELPASIRTDPTRLRQILVNLVGNAIKFTPSGSVGVHCSRETGARGEPTVRFDVRDTGIGMTEDERRRVERFDAFTQVDGSTTRRSGGTGLGLRISHSLATMLGGTLSIESVVDRGSTFTVTVPAPSSAASISPPRHRGDETPERSDVSSADRAPAALRNRLVLLAEDGPDNRRLVTLHLERAGARVLHAENGLAACEAIERGAEPIDLVLMDMLMPELDGYEATRRLRAAGCTLPIVALTANAMVGDDSKCLAAGCDGYLAKPIDARALVRTCRAALERRAA